MKKFSKNFLLCLGGVLIGAVNGLLGGGGGMLTVPILERFGGMSAKKSHATAILVILPISVFSAAVYILSGKLEIASALTAGAGVVAGGILGAVLLSKLGNRFLRIAFALLMVAIGIKSFF